MSDKLESKLEEYLRSKIKARGGMVIKMVAIVAGTPDDLVVLPGGRFHVVELKTKKGTRSPLQVVIHERWKRLGVHVTTLHGQPEIDRWLDTLDTPVYPRPKPRVLRSDTKPR